MNWWGKLLGGAFGFVLGGPLGAMLGAALGHSFDTGLRRLDQAGVIGEGATEQIQLAFFTATFAVMGKLAKADGQVSGIEIDRARQVMNDMGLNDDQQRLAIDLFNQGKQTEYPLHDIVAQLKKECRQRRNLLQIFLEIQMSVALADGELHPEELRLLRSLTADLGFTAGQFEQLLAMQVAQQRYRAEQASSPQGAVDGVADAYAVLGVDASVSDAELKRTYRRLMSQHHPDKLIAKGLPEEMMKLATEKTQEIKAAYERIKAARNASA